MGAPRRPDRFESMTVEEDGLPLSLLIVDDSPLRRACIAAALDPARFRVVPQSGLDRPEPGEAPDIILFQTGDSEREATTLPLQIAEAQRQWPGTPILVMADHEPLMLEALTAGAQGLLLSSTDIGSMQRALVLLKHGLAVYPASLAAAMQARLQSPGGAARMGERLSLAVDQFALLTKRQRDVLRLLAQGASNKDIAQRLQISESTVKVHVRAIMAVNGASNRTQIVAHLLKGGHDDGDE